MAMPVVHQIFSFPMKNYPFVHLRTSKEVGNSSLKFLLISFASKANCPMSTADNDRSGMDENISISL